MVRIAGQTPTMDNREELLDALNDFSRKQPKEIPPLLEQFLKQVAKTGETLFPWTLLKPLFVAKLEQVMAEFGQEFASEPLPPCPNVENARFEVYKSRIMEAVHRFNGAPFTIQRLCELLTDPRRHYKRCDKFLRGLEKNVLVVSTVDPFGRKVVSESKNLMNGMDSANSVDEAQNTATTSNSATPPVPSWTTSSPTTVWPVNADAVITSTSPLLEVSDLPDPKEAVANSAAATATTTATPTSQDPPAQVNGHHSVSSSVEVKTDSESGNVTSAGSPDKSEAVASSVVTPVTSVAETVDSSDQLVAAEEMVGVEEEGAATSTAISQQSAPGMAEETVETAPAAAEVSKEEAAEAKESSGEATSAASEDCSSNATDNPPAPSTSSDPGQSSDTSTPDTATPDTSTTDQTATDSDTAKTTQDTDNTEAEAAGREGGVETVNGAEGESVSASQEDAESAMEKTVSEDENISDSSSSQPEAAASESEPAPSETSQTKTLTATSDTTETPQSSSSTADTTTATTTTSTQGPEANSSNEQSEVSTAAEAEPAETMETDSGDASSNASQAAERSDSSSAPSDSDTKDAPQMESDVSDSTATAEPMEHD